MEPTKTLITAPAYSILDLPEVEMTYLAQQWTLARERFLFFVLTRKGMAPEQLRHNTADTYRTALSQFLDPQFDSYGVMLWPGLKPWETSRQHIDLWLAWLGTAGQAKRGWRMVAGKRTYVEIGRKGLAAASVATKLAALKEFFDFAQNRFEVQYQPGLHNVFLSNDPALLFLTENRRTVTLWSPQWRNPFAAEAISRPVVDPYGKSVEPNTEEVARIFREINRTTLTGLRDYAFLMCLYSTACRVSEVLNLKWGDLVSKGSGYVFRFRGKGGKWDEVPLEREVYADIEAYLAGGGRLERMGPDDYIFAALYPERQRNLGRTEVVDEKRPINRSQANRMLKKYAKRAGVDLDKAHPHALRHAATVATAEEMRRRNGAVDILELKRILRHSNVSTTQIYADKKLEDPRDPWASSRIAAVRPTSRRPRRKSQAPVAQVSLTPELEIERLRAEVARLQKELEER